MKLFIIVSKQKHLKMKAIELNNLNGL